MKITICGSRRFKEIIMRVYNSLTEKGHLVYLPYMKDVVQLEGETDDRRFRALVSDLHQVHKDKIMESDMILVVDNDGNLNSESYIGDDTKREIDLAVENNISVVFLSNINVVKQLFGFWGGDFNEKGDSK